MTRPWLQAGIAQAMQQIINPVQGILYPELLFEDALKVFAAKRADAIASVGAGFDAEMKSGFVVTPKFGCRAGARPLGEVGRSTVAITISPLLHKPPTAIEFGGDLRCRHSIQRKQNRSASITLFGVTLLSLKLLEDIQILRATKFDVHAKPPCSNRKEV